MVPAAAETESGFKGFVAATAGPVAQLRDNTARRVVSVPHHDDSRHARCDAQCKGFAVFWIPKSVSNLYMTVSESWRVHGLMETGSCILSHGVTPPKNTEGIHSK